MYFIFNDLIGLVWIAWMLMSHDQLPAEDVTKMKEQIDEVRAKLANKDSMTGEEIKKTVGDLQQSSLKLFEMALYWIVHHFKNPS